MTAQTNHERMADYLRDLVDQVSVDKYKNTSDQTLRLQWQRGFLLGVISDLALRDSRVLDQIRSRLRSLGGE